MSTEFTCEACGGLFDNETPEDEALAEATALFGPIAPEDRAIVCHDCWCAMMAEIPPGPLGKA